MAQSMEWCPHCWRLPIPGGSQRDQPCRGASFRLGRRKPVAHGKGWARWECPTRLMSCKATSECAIFPLCAWELTVERHFVVTQFFRARKKSRQSYTKVIDISIYWANYEKERRKHTACMSLLSQLISVCVGVVYPCIGPQWAGNATAPIFGSSKHLEYRP